MYERAFLFIEMMHANGSLDKERILIVHIVLEKILTIIPNVPSMLCVFPLELYSCLT